MHTPSHRNGFSLVETIIALGVLTVGVMGAAGILATGMQKLTSSPADVIIMQKATQAIEAVFSARDSHRFINVACLSACEWAQLRNVLGGSGNDGGIFLDGPQLLHTPGPDGLVNTTDDDTAIESVVLPGLDQKLNTSDDKTVFLTQYTREIAIRDVPNENGQLRKVTVTVTWGDPGGLLPFANGPTKRTYTLVTFISSYG